MITTAKKRRKYIHWSREPSSARVRTGALINWLISICVDYCNVTDVSAPHSDKSRENDDNNSQETKRTIHTLIQGAFQCRGSNWSLSPDSQSAWIERRPCPRELGCFGFQHIGNCSDASCSKLASRDDAEQEIKREKRQPYKSLKIKIKNL